MFYPILVILLAAAASSVSQSCYEYCITRLANREKSPVPEDCNCSPLDVLEADFKEPSIPLDDTGVYFEPAEEILFQEKFNTKPFHISNPIKVVTKTKRSKVKEESVSNKDYSFETIGLVKEETVFQVHTHEKKKMSPTYLDLEIQGATSSSENGGKNSLIENLESTERSLEKCLDFHVINYTRRHGIAENFKEFWEARNLKVYEHLSDSDLTSMIQQYCQQPGFIVEESLRDIMRRIPKKNTTHGTNNQRNVDSERITTPRFERNDNDESFIASFSELEVPRVDSTSAYDGTTEPTITYGTFIEHMSRENNITDIEYPMYSLNSTPITDLMKNIMRSTIEYPDESLNGTLIEIVPDVSDFSESAIYSPNLTTTSQEYINSDTIFDLDTMPSDVFYTAYNETNKNNARNEIISEAITTSSPFSTSFSDNNILDESNISNYDISTTIASVIYPENRNVLKETEIILPKIITKEFKNNTIQSFIDAYEILPNNDFSEDRADSTDEAHTVTDSKSIFESTTNKRTTSDNNYISGNLYFGSSQELVPVRILQSDGGKIHLAINGDTLCDKLIKKTNNKSRLLATLCECVRTNMVQNNNSTNINIL